MTIPSKTTRSGKKLPLRLLVLFPYIFLIGCMNPLRNPPVLSATASGGDGKVVIADPIPSVKSSADQTNDFDESFDRAKSMTETCFSEVHPIGTGRFEIDSLSGVAGAPTGESLPVSGGLDKELRYFEGEGGIAGSHSMAVAPFTAGYVDSCVSGFLGASVASEVFGSRTAGFIIRARGNGWAQDAYVATVSFGFGKNDKVSCHLALMKKGVIQKDNVSDHSGTYPLDYGTENVFLELKAIGDQITATFWRVDGSGQKEPLTTLSIQDDTLQAGGDGVFAFCRGNKSVFFDDIRIRKISE